MNTVLFSPFALWVMGGKHFCVPALPRNLLPPLWHEMPCCAVTRCAAGQELRIC
jgi:hypothetical protein